MQLMLAHRLTTLQVDQGARTRKEFKASEWEVKSEAKQGMGVYRSKTQTLSIPELKSN